MSGQQVGKYDKLSVYEGGGVRYTEIFWTSLVFG